METPERRIVAAGLQLPQAPEPKYSYRAFTRSGPFVYVSGQVPFIGDGELLARGKLGQQVSVESGQACARQAVLNALAVLRSAVGELSKVRQVLKLTVFVASAPDFIGQPGIADGASQLLADILGAPGEHARSAVGVAVLPLDAPVEVELIAEVDGTN